jgi:hypothetical protein
MVRAIRNKHYEETKNMTEEEKTLFDRQKTEAGIREFQEYCLAKAKSQVPSV